MGNKATAMFIVSFILMVANLVQIVGITQLRTQSVQMGCAEYNSKNGSFQWVDRSK